MANNRIDYTEPEAVLIKINCPDKTVYEYSPLLTSNCASDVSKSQFDIGDSNFDVINFLIFLQRQTLLAASPNLPELPEKLVKIKEKKSAKKKIKNSKREPIKQRKWTSIKHRQQQPRRQTHFNLKPQIRQ